ncbi:MAG: ThiF family adenylyltransferase [Candidatus Dormibacteraeota bacterium]|nr:ThiF family adenylyltransferase [Candidatus Dormibacteraeota bacterium]
MSELPPAPPAVGRQVAPITELEQARMVAATVALIGVGRGGSMVADQLAHMGAGQTVERYVREWLEQQAVAGFLSVDNPDAEPGQRRFGLPAAHRPVFVDEEDLNHLTPLATLAVGMLRPIDELLDAYRRGGGVPYEAFDADTREGISGINHPMFVNMPIDHDFWRFYRLVP